MQLKRAIELFFASFFDQSDRSPRTRKAYGGDMAQFAAFVGPNRALHSIEPEDCELWVAALKKQGCAPATRKRKLATLRCFFNECVRRERLDASPLQRLRFRFPTGTQLPRTLTVNEARAILTQVRKKPRARSLHQKALAQRNRAIIELLLATGIRVGELTALDIGDVNLDQREIVIQGKGGRQRLAFLVDPNCFEAIEVHLKFRNGIQTNTKALFLNESKARLSPQGVARVIATLAKQAKISRRLTPHMFRHTAATLLLQNGVDIRVVQVFLGHASILTTQRYAHVTQDHLRSQLRKAHSSHMLGSLASAS